MRYLVIGAIVAIALVLPLDTSFARGFVSKSGELMISELGEFKITEQRQTPEKNRLLLKLRTKDEHKDEYYNGANFSIFDVNSFNVFDPKVLQKYVDALRKSGNAIVTVKPVTWDGRRYQCIFMTKLAEANGKPLVVFTQQFLLVHKGRFHNITFSSTRDQLETNPAFIELLKHTKFRK